MTAYSVTAPGGKMPVFVLGRHEVSANFGLIATTAADKACLRVAGGCSGMSAEDRRSMLGYFTAALAGFKGMIWSGGTRAIAAGGEVDPMVTEVPAAVARANPGAVALGTAPRTGCLHLAGESRLELDEGGTAPNPELTAVAIVQDGADNPLGWDGDLEMYFGMMDRLRRFAGFRAVGVVAWNGGGVTAAEVMRSAKLGWPTIVIRGSGRKADEFAQRLDASDPGLLAELPQGHKLLVADRADPGSLRALLAAHAFLPGT